MTWARKTYLAFVLGSLLSTVGCCYHAQHFGRARDIGIGEVGCDTCRSGTNCCPTNPGTKVSCTDQGCGATVAKDSARGTSSVSVSIREPGRSLISKIRDSLEARKVEKAAPELPVYVLSSECISNGVIVNPNPVQMVAPTTKTVSHEVPIRIAPDDKN